jgi:hypothetical protein
MIEYNQESIFNMALAYLKRIDKLLYMCDIHSMNGDVYKWNSCLMIIFRELCIKLSKEERLDMEGDYINIIDKDKDNQLDNNEIYLINSLSINNANFKNLNFLINNPVYMAKYKKQILFLLHELEMKIRIKMQEKGMLLPSKDDPRRAITQR